MVDDRSEADKRNAALLRVVDAAIKRVDPYDLIDDGAPSNEFEPEISKIAAEVPKAPGAQDFARFIAQVMNESGEKSFTAENSLPIAKQILAESARRGLNKA